MKTVQIVKLLLVSYVVIKVIYLLELLVNATIKNAEVLQQLVDLFQRSKYFR